MNYLGLWEIKLRILSRKLLLNLLLLVFSTRNNFIVTLSQDLDKYIVLYQKELFMLHSPNNAKKLIK